MNAKRIVMIIQNMLPQKREQSTISWVESNMGMDLDTLMAILAPIIFVFQSINQLNKLHASKMSKF